MRVKFGGKAFQTKLFFTLVSQCLPSSFLSRPVGYVSSLSEPNYANDWRGKKAANLV